LWRAKGHSSIRPREHDVTPVAGAELLHCGNHVNIVVSGSAGAIHSQKDLTANPPGFICAPNKTLPPRLTEVFWSKVGVTLPFCALLSEYKKRAPEISRR
jgi:hypothetical protein